MNLRALFIEAVSGSLDLPSQLRDTASQVTNLAEHRFDLSYIDFLDTMIRLNSRGADWTELLKKRRAALQPFCETTLLRGVVTVEKIYYSLEINPMNKAVVHWESHAMEDM